jgi:hypothetical protein
MARSQEDPRHGFFMTLPRRIHVKKDNTTTLYSESAIHRAGRLETILNDIAWDEDDEKSHRRVAIARAAPLPGRACHITGHMPHGTLE